MRPDFSKIDFKTTPKVDQDFKEWAKQNDIDAEWLTAEQIPVKSVYGKEDLEGMEHLNYAAGLPPFLRGPYSTMYVNKPWTIRQYAGFSTAEEAATEAIRATRINIYKLNFLISYWYILSNLPT